MYLSLQRLSGRMVLQLVLKVSVSDASVYSSSTSIDLGQMWCEPRPQIAPLSAQVRMDLIPKKFNIYVNKEILDSRPSFRGSSPSSRPTQ